uniref:U1-type domain-containing protein n=1 Tax=Amphimedon queenslandica TaxID=400682 RepID=A0A1X7U3D8_AMPQE
MLEYPHECFKVYSISLFCDACREPLSLKKSDIESHIKSKKHRNGKERLASKEKRENAIDDMLQGYNGNVHPVGESFPSTVRIF